MVPLGNILFIFLHQTHQDGQGSVINSTVTNSSKEITSFSDFPFPDNWPNFLSHSLVGEYMN